MSAFACVCLLLSAFSLRFWEPEICLSLLLRPCVCYRLRLTAFLWRSKFWLFLCSPKSPGKKDFVRELRSKEGTHFKARIKRILLFSAEGHVFWWRDVHLEREDALPSTCHQHANLVIAFGRARSCMLWSSCAVLLQTSLPNMFSLKTARVNHYSWVSLMECLLLKNGKLHFDHLFLQFFLRFAIARRSQRFLRAFLFLVAENKRNIINAHQKT